MDTYEKKYNEALKDMKAIYPNLKGDARLAVEHAFPELAESEDERINKVIYKLMLGMREEIFTSQDEVVTKDKALAYLEKLKEQKPMEIDEDVELGLDRALQIVEKAKGNLQGYQTDDGIYECDHAIGTLKHILKRGVEQKPAEWSEFDEDCLKRAIWYVENPAPSVIKDSRLALWLNMLRSRFFLRPQQKEEWSEEDKAMIERLIRHTKKEFDELCNDRYGHQEIISDLKESCRERMNWLENRLKSLRPQPREEIYQAAKHDLAIKFMNYLDENRPEGKMSLSNSECEDIDKAFKENDWEKIIRYIEKYSSHWKPSEEQILALERAVDALKVYTSYIPLISLLEHLKKL